MRRLVNGTAVAWRGQGVLILGPTGSGKSDLTLRLIDSGATLIAGGGGTSTGVIGRWKTTSTSSGCALLRSIPAGSINTMANATA